jgi:hypothetical protein
LKKKHGSLARLPIFANSMLDFAVVREVLAAVMRDDAGSVLTDTAFILPAPNKDEGFDDSANFPLAESPIAETLVLPS